MCVCASGALNLNGNENGKLKILLAEPLEFSHALSLSPSHTHLTRKSSALQHARNFSYFPLRPDKSDRITARNLLSANLRDKEKLKGF